MGVTYKKRKVGNASVFRCEGDFVYGAEIVDLHRAVKAALAKTPYIVLDLSRVPVMDSAGIGTLCGIYTSALSAHGGLKLVGVTERVRHVLRITKVVTLLDIHDSEEAALRSVRSAAAS
jgi:anti-anti-sigma factor